MSNIAIKGATTGTGTFTIESPATNTDRTLTLPDEAGTVLTGASALSSDNFPSGTVVGFARSDVQFTADAGTSSTTAVEISSDLRITYTPKSASNLLLVSVFFTDGYVSGNNLQIQVLDISDTSSIFGFTGNMYRIYSQYDHVHVHGATKVAPAWSGSKTISVYGRAGNGTNAYWNWSGPNGHGSLSITEIAQ